jgi:hypothetical protein
LRWIAGVSFELTVLARVSCGESERINWDLLYGIDGRIKYSAAAMTDGENARCHNFKNYAPFFTARSQV